MLNEIIKLVAGSRVNAIKWNMTPLHYAVSNNNRVLVELLLSHGADTRIKNSHGRTAYDLARSDPIRSLIKVHEGKTH